MRVAWVHPSWRDLVIEHLRSDDDARERFLHSCSIHGVLLALSCAGGHTGARQLPLLRRDADWDALTDRVYDLVPELEPAELVGLMDALVLTIRDVADPSAMTEAQAIAGAGLARVRSLWNATPAPIPLAALETWLTLAAALSPPPPPPAMAITWAELLPAAAPDLSDHAALERFADWLTLVELLLDHDPDLLAGLGFPGHSPQFCDGFLSSLERDGGPTQPRALAQALRALRRIPRVIPALTDRADSARLRLRGREELLSPPITHPAAPRTARNTGHLDVRRVLEDL